MTQAKQRGIEFVLFLPDQRFGQRLGSRRGDSDEGSAPRLAYPLLGTPNGYWNFALEGVHEYKLSILREAAEDYDFDGIELDFARVCPVLPPGHQWEYRDRLTDFIRATRAMLLEVERKRGRPFLLAARVPENLEGLSF